MVKCTICCTLNKLLRYYCFILKTIILSTLIDKFIVSLSQYNGVSPYRAENDNKKMDNISFQVNIKRIFTDFYPVNDIKLHKNGPFHRFIYCIISFILFYMAFSISFSFWHFSMNNLFDARHFRVG